VDGDQVFLLLGRKELLVHKVYLGLMEMMV
jgi:hypothetical protein